MNNTISKQNFNINGEGRPVAQRRRVWMNSSVLVGSRATNEQDFGPHKTIMFLISLFQTFSRQITYQFLFFRIIIFKRVESRTMVPLFGD